MLRLVMISAWICAVALGATYSAFYFRSRPAQQASVAHASHPKAQDLKTITVPIIRDGQIRGYITADFSMIGQETDPHQPTPEIEGYVLDEAYRMIYAETGIDFASIQKTDLARLTSDIKSHVNHRLEREALQDILIRGFHYVPRDELQR